MHGVVINAFLLCVFAFRKVLNIDCRYKFPFVGRKQKKCFPQFRHSHFVYDRCFHIRLCIRKNFRTESFVRVQSKAS